MMLNIEKRNKKMYVNNIKISRSTKILFGGQGESHFSNNASLVNPTNINHHWFLCGVKFINMYFIEI